MSEDPDEMLAMLADLTGATDPQAARTREAPGGSAVSRRRTARAGTTAGHRQAHDAALPTRRRRPRSRCESRRGDHGRSSGSAVDPDDLRVRSWSTPGTAICLLVDRSGSMGGKPLATNAVAASAVAWRAPDDYSVLTFGKDVVAAKSQDVTKSNEAVVDAVLAFAGSAPPMSPVRWRRRGISSRGRPRHARSPCCCRTVERRWRAMRSGRPPDSTSW